LPVDQEFKLDVILKCYIITVELPQTLQS
jgi:hypothetical protein